MTTALQLTLIIVCISLFLKTGPTPEDHEAKFRGTQREYSSKLLKHRIFKRILVFKR